MSSGVLDSRPEVKRTPFLFTFFFIINMFCNVVKCLTFIDQVLEIRGDKTRVIRSESETFSELQAVDYM